VQVLLALAAGAAACTAAAYMAVARLGAVQAVLAFVLRRVLGRLQLAAAGYGSAAERRASGADALPPASVRKTPMGAVARTLRSLLRAADVARPGSLQSLPSKFKRDKVVLQTIQICVAITCRHIFSVYICVIFVYKKA